MWPWSQFSLNCLEIAEENQEMSLFVQEKAKLGDLVSEKVTRLIRTLQIDNLYFIKSHLCYNALWSEGEIAAWVLLRFCGSIETNENGMIKMCVEIPRGHLFHISIPHSPIFFSLFLFHSSFSFIFFFPHRTFTILYSRANSRSFNFSPPSITSFPLSATFS